MVYAVIVAGGKGTRMGNDGLPKQFMMIGDKPILVYTTEKFLSNSRFDKILVMCPHNYLDYTRELFKKYSIENDKIVVLAGGTTRNETIMNSISFIEENDILTDDTVIVTHDAVRPFVSARSIDENIDAAMKYDAIDTVFPATDTIIESMDNETISDVPDRSKMYYGQTPQSFKAKKFKELYLNLTDEQRDTLTDGCMIFTLSGVPVHLVKGDVQNNKITYAHDLTVASILAKEEKK